MGQDGATHGKVLIIDADAGRVTALERRLRYLRYEPVIAGEDIAPSLPRDEIAVVVGDADGKPDVANRVKRLRDSNPTLPFLRVPSTSGGYVRSDDGPNWALDLPLKRSQMARLLRRARRYRGNERRHRLTGNSRPIRRVRELIEQVADFDTNVLVTGESGTGKELVARTIHDLSDRADMPFVPINCGAIPADLLESELFGHEKGAFTGAITARTGRFELAEGGTLFLDEIGDMSLPMQVKLLRVLQERTFERIGSNRSLVSNVRIIAATHRDLPAAVDAGEFREDLYYRLNVFPIDMPPLFKRVSDLPMLLDELLIAHGGKNRGGLRVSAAALQALAGHRWPGNIRELSNLVERLAIVKPEGVIDVDDLPAKYRQADAVLTTERNDVTQAMQLSSTNLREHLQSLEQDLIGQALKAADGVVANAARLLQMRRTTLVEKIAKYKIA